METPFYMSYPLQNLYLAELEYEKDMERTKEWYSKEVLQIQSLVEKHCDSLEFEGSRMFDENPDRDMINREKELLCKKVFERYEQTPSIVGEELQQEEVRTRFPIPEKFMVKTESSITAQDYCASCHEDTWLEAIVGILLGNEIYRRRCKRRRCNRWW